MASSYKQQALVRKFVYVGLIVALFTVSLLHRRLVVEPQGNNLLLREVSKGEVKLTDSAVRLALTGSRGIAVTFLWSAAIEKQKKHEWNELDLLVSSMTKLQPHFVTPWLFQSWNLAFNVAVECDRPRDKYFYVSRGLEVLAEGERRNYKPPAPGNPDIRQNMGTYYQLKIGQSDEKNYMRCLLDLSCIDPLERAPDRLTFETDRGRKVRPDKFKEFCIRQPRLVRRLHDQLKLATPEDIVVFLEENKDVPSRFEPPAGGPQQKDSVVKEELEQFPILPPGRPNPTGRELSTTELVDVFFISRNWFEYAQQPLPEPTTDLSARVTPPNPMEKRLPRFIAGPIFRGMPARAQAYIAENLEAEGWFDSDGWAIKDWFDKERGPNTPELRVGTEPRFHAGPSWETAYRMYLDYGARTGLYLTPAEQADLTRAAEGYRRAFNVKEGEIGAIELKPQHPAYEGYHAHHRLVYAGVYGAMTNFPALFTQSEAERAPATVTARKYLYNAERLKRAYEPERAIALYEKAWQLWAQVLLGHPRFAHNESVQEDLYEVQFPYNNYVQRHRAEDFKKLLLSMVQCALWPHPPVEELLRLDRPPDETRDVDYVDGDQILRRIMPVRNHRGMLDNLEYYDGPGAQELKLALAAWTNGAMQGMHCLYPLGVDCQLAGYLPRETTPPPDWYTFVSQDAINRVRTRLGLNRLDVVEKK